MPRNQNAGNPSLRNRNRVTNKTRLKVIKGNIDADPIVLDEDEERARVVSTAGVDAEDANEHHLQAVLSAAAHRATTLAQKQTRSASTENNEKQTESSSAFIPVPDAAGIVDNVADLYPPDRWTEPTSYVKFSNTVDDCMSNALVDGFTYAMDERDAEWLDKNNQEARGEGTSSQASSSGTTTRSGGLHRSAKSKGKEAEPLTPVPMSEDEFELVMGLFEKATHDNTPFLHVSFQQQLGTSIPPFTDYHDVFANDLSPSHFATFIRPANIPPSQSLVRMARAVYPHWRERKIEREGHRIIPTLNFDESDTLNESYICFRRREIKAVRKTRAAQVSSYDKLVRLKGELAHAYELARNILGRERQKRENHNEAKGVWEKRMALVDLKRKFPVFGGRDEEDLLFDKERVPKKPKPSDQTSTTVLNGDVSASPAPGEAQIRPKDRYNAIQVSMDHIMKRAKENDHGWDDQIDTPYQQPPVSYPDRFFKCIRSDSATTPSAHEQCPREPQHLRFRRGRGGRLHIDRRRPNSRLTFSGSDLLRLRSRKDLEDEDVTFSEERMNRIAERWRYDSIGEVGMDDEDRVLVDDFQPKHVRFQAKLLLDQEHSMLSTDSRLYLFDAQTGSHNYVIPHRMSVTPQSRRDPNVYQLRAPPPPTLVQTLAGQQPAVPQVSSSVQLPNPTPIALQSPVKMAPPNLSLHSRTPSNGPQRPPSSSSLHSAQSANGPTSSSPITQGNASQVNGIPSQKSPINSLSTAPMPIANSVVNGVGNGIPNGSNNAHAGFPNNLTSLTLTETQALAAQQSKQFNKMYANYQLPNGMQRSGQAVYAQHMMNGINGANGNSNGNNVSLSGPVNMNLKLPAQRQMQWSTATQRTQGPPNSGDMSGIQGMQNMQMAGLNGLMPGHAASVMNGHLSPPRAASALSPPNSLAGHAQERTSPSHPILSHSLSLSPHMGSPAQSQSQSQSHISPIRNMQTPVPPSPSPLLQHQLPNLVGGMPSQGQGF
ncbi:enhancer of polycomb-like-domain-containing protein [Phellopilus nigrolimitatus]|nr:enhancer of polycomb-like-domain-containing protein [Phellopilus nigrolimitatus]